MTAVAIGQSAPSGKAVPVIETRCLRHSFGRRSVLKGVSFVVEPGTLVGIVGQNGSGKSTLLRILAGELHADAGDVVRRAPLGYCPQSPILNEALSVDHHLAYFAAAYGLPDLTFAVDLIAQLEYSEYRTTPVRALSGGTRQKLNLTLALMHRPALLLLDEPYQGFDWETYVRFWGLVDDLKRAGRSILIISHLLFERKRFDRVLRLNEGLIEGELV